MQEINLHGHKIQIYSDKVRFFKARDNFMDDFDYKAVCNHLMRYLYAEAFLQKREYDMEIVDCPTKK
jgi:hypothetical protein